MTKISFFGAAETVTGSCYLVETNESKFLVDCGMFQGPDVEHLNLEDFEFDESKLDFVLLTHAHIDHSGMLPKLTAHGFKGPIYATAHTIQISTELLMDSAKIQETAYRKGETYGKYTMQRGIVYNTNDAKECISQFKNVYFDDTITPASGISVRFIRAGHILGSASIEVTIEDNDTTKKIVFSGDIGRNKSHIDTTFDPNHSWDPDYVLLESLYGGEVHPDRDQSTNELVKLINQTVSRGGNVYIPCFAVQRTQEVLNDLKRSFETGMLNKETEVWLDSPLAQRVTEIYVSALQSNLDNLFDFPSLHYVKKYQESLMLSRKRGIVVIAGSGMADGGRIMEHLSGGLENPRNSIIFVGFQAEGTLGRELVEGAKVVNIGRKKVRVKSNIYHLKGFSAHGDTNDYTDWIKRYKNKNLKKVFLIHAEINRSISMKNILEQQGYSSIIPKLGQSFDI